MSDSESVDYLQSDFDPWTLTVPRLRSILVTHNVPYPATAKKPQLIELFNKHVVPQSQAILARRLRAKRSSMGIIDADSQDTGTSTDFDHDRDLRPPPSVSSRRSRSPRKSARVKREPEDSDRDHHLPPATPSFRESPRKRSSRSASIQPASTYDSDVSVPDTEPARSVRGHRLTTPVPKLEPPEEEDDSFFKRTPETEGIFTDDNPFQSGANTPASAFKTPASTRRKTTMGVFESARKTPSTVTMSSRRRTEDPIYTGQEIEEPPSTISSVNTSRTIEVPFSSRAYRSKTPETVQYEETEPDEEFTPEEQLALMEEERANPELAAARRPPEPPKRRSSLWTPIWVLFTTLLVAYAAWYRQEKIAVGYCGLGREPTEVLPSSLPIPEWASEVAAKLDIQTIEVPDWLRAAFKPQCEPCPPHAYCYEDFTARCESDYLLKPHPLALGGLIPLPPTCEPDSDKLRRVQAVADKAVEELRERRAKFECGESLEPNGPPVDSPAIEEEELKAILSKKRSKRMAAEEFDELWVAAIGEIKAREEVEVQQVETPTEFRAGPGTGGYPHSFPTPKLSSHSLARLPYACAIRRSVKLGVARHRLSIGGVIFAVFMVLYARRRYLRNRAWAAQIPTLVDEVLGRLEAQKELAFEAGGDEVDAFLFLPNLRDDMLRSIHNIKEREALWQRVKVVVEQNSNVRTGQREGRNGEVGRAWEWIGPTMSRTGDGSTARRRNTMGMRVSWGEDVKGSGDETPKAGDRTFRKWEEGGTGRVIY